MTVRLVALFRKPDDVEAFTRHYRDVHLPLVAKTPHLQKTLVGRVTGAPMGNSSYFMVTEMFFQDVERFQEAMRSSENKAAGKDLMGFAKDLVTLLVVEDT